MQFYGTTHLPRDNVQPGMLVRHKGRTWRASANVMQGLYLDSLAVKTRVTDELIEVCLDHRGQPATH
ncbi:cell division protein FtsZ [Mixta intestinalis]|uniref:Killing protein KilR n=1 Tax=Mixta intestinalis TaxID=1615494 RepID=A0A6P1PZW5_9GAMM|nr:cell division protein FtsZ [Mixta intestinalis]QHM71318.1 Killing protein KilR [Mixta intestinalis]